MMKVIFVVILVLTFGRINDGQIFELVYEIAVIQRDQRNALGFSYGTNHEIRQNTILLASSLAAAIVLEDLPGRKKTVVVGAQVGDTKLI